MLICPVAGTVRPESSGSCLPHALRFLPLLVGFHWVKLKSAGLRRPLQVADSADKSRPEEGNCHLAKREPCSTPPNPPLPPTTYADSANKPKQLQLTVRRPEEQQQQVGIINKSRVAASESACAETGQFAVRTLMRTGLSWSSTTNQIQFLPSWGIPCGSFIDPLSSARCTPLANYYKKHFTLLIETMQELVIFLWLWLHIAQMLQVFQRNP